MNPGCLPGTGGRFSSPVLPVPTVTGPGPVVAHGLHVTPTQVAWRLVCLQPDLGYGPGDEVDLTSTQFNNGYFTSWSNAATVGLSWRANGVVVNHRTTGTATATTAGKWGLKVYATA